MTTNRLGFSMIVAIAAALAACGGSPADADGDAGADVDADPVDPMCADPAAPRALAFDGVDDHVSMGVAPELGLATFTVEAWVRRDGDGADFGTGVGGLRLVPIAGKGRGENDGSNLDCNYAFGFWGEVLGADFEDVASGGNHPVTGATAVPRGTWHHVAATYDGSTWRLYLDGRLDAERTVNATPRADSIQHAGIGTSFDSAGDPRGRLHGAVDELRVWDHARTGAEIAGGMYRTIASADGLVGRWALDDDADDSAGALDGTVAGDAAFIDGGAVLDRGVPPQARPVFPDDAQAVPGSEVDLGVAVSDPDGDDVTVRFHLRELGDDQDFTIVVLPDTQYYTVTDRELADYFYDQTAWVRANRDLYDIVAVIHNGDLVDHGDQFDAEWQVADTAMSTLETAEPELPDGVPYGISVGNHDQSPNGATGSTAKFNAYFGVDRFRERAYYGGNYAGTNDDSWFTFSAAGLDFVVVNLQYDTTPDAAVQAWARSIFQMHPEAFGILNTHYLLRGSGAFSDQGQAIYAALRDVDNLQLMTCGHVGAEARRTDVHQGNAIHSMLADYQFETDGGSGKLRIWELSPAAGEVTVRTYSPSLDRWYTGEASEFTLPVDLSGAGGAFDEVATVAGADGVATARVSGLEPGRTYEWYATAETCDHSARTPVRRFTAAASSAAPRPSAAGRTPPPRARARR